MEKRSLLDPALIIKNVVPDFLMWSKINYLYIFLNIIIPIIIFITICFFLKDSYESKQNPMLKYLK